MKLKNLLNKVSRYTNNITDYSRIEILSKKMNDLKNVSLFVNNNFKVKKSGIFYYVPDKDSYKLRFVIEKNFHSHNCLKVLESYIYNNKFETSEVKDVFIENVENDIRVNSIKPNKSIISLFDIDLKNNIFKRDCFDYSHNSNDFNDICGNYIKFLKKNHSKIDIISFGFGSPFNNPGDLSELNKHNLVKFLEFLRANKSLSNKLLAIKTSDCQLAELMIRKGVHIIYDETGGAYNSNILNIVKDSQVPFIMGNHVLTQHKFELSNKNAFFIDYFVGSLLERMELLYSRGILNHNVFFDPCFNNIKNKQDAEQIFSNFKSIGEEFECQLVNVPRLKNKKNTNTYAQNVDKTYTSIMKFDSIIGFEKEYKNIFRDITEKPIPNYSEKRVTYDDYNVKIKDYEKAKIIKKDNIDVFSRDSDNFVKEDIIMNIMKKLNKD